MLRTYAGGRVLCRGRTVCITTGLQLLRQGRRAARDGGGRGGWVGEPSVSSDGSCRGDGAGGAARDSADGAGSGLGCLAGEPCAGSDGSCCGDGADRRLATGASVDAEAGPAS